MVRAAVVAALAAPCGAFVQQGNLRTQLPAAAPGAVEAAGGAGAAQSARPMDAQAPGVLACGVAAAGLAVGASRVASIRQRKASCVERQVVGVCLPLTEKWDPLNLGSTDAKMEQYAAAEVKHGRVAMIATMGYFVPDIFRFPGCENFKTGLGALGSIPSEIWFGFLFFIGVHEVAVKPRAGGLGPWDYGLGTEVLEGIDEEELERKQTVERNNGRLAMIAIMGLMVQDSKFGAPLEFMSKNGAWGPDVDWLIKDIPACMGTSFCAVKPATRGPGLTAMRAEAAEAPRMSASMPFLLHPRPLDGWVGGEKGFDPLNCTMALPTYIVREAELKHGRVCMLATLGWIATDLGVRFPAPLFQECTTISAHDKLVEAGVMGPFLAAIGVCELYGGWLFLEGFTREIKRDAGDFFFGKTFLPKDEEQANIMKLKELENGRLAMLAFSGICTQAVITGKPWPFL